MKVVIVSGSYPPIKCGVGDYTSWLMNGLNHELESVTVISSKTARPTDEVRPIIDIWNISSTGRVVRDISSLRPDLVHIQYPTVSYGRKLGINLLPLVLRMRFPRLPVIVTAHEYHDASVLGKLRVILTVLFAHRIITVNVETYQSLKRALPFKSIALIPIGSNIPVAELTQDNRMKLRARFGLTTMKLVTYFGFIDPSKGVERLVMAAAGLPADYKVLLVTSYRPDDDYHKSVRKLVDQAGGKVIWTDYLSPEDVSGLLQESEAVVLPFDSPTSLRRGSLVAAIAHGLPTIITGPVRDPLIDRQNCLVLSSVTPEAIVRSITELSKDAELSKIIRVNAHVLGKTFDWEKIANEHCRLYEALVERR